MNLLRVNNLSVTLNLPAHSIYAVDGISFTLQEGEILGLVGESASGKTQAMLAALGLSSAEAICTGEVIYRNLNLLTIPAAQMQQIRGNDIAMIFQDPMSSLNPYLRISTQLTEAMQYHQQQDRKTARRLAIEMLERVQIPNASQRIDHYPHQFSGGMRQRIMIAMALLRHPKVLIADEPTTALDVTVQAEILALLKSLRDDFALSIIFITHDMAIVAGTCDRVMVMYAGRLTEQGSVGDLFANSKHPYTQGLLKAARSVTHADQLLYSIPGSPPKNISQHAGCAFAPRCEHQLAHCASVVPSVTSFEQQHQCACHLYA